MKIKTILINPGSDSGGRVIIKVIEKEIKGITFIKQFKTLKKDIFVNLMKYASALVGNSSGGILEAPFIKLPVVNIGKRQEQREHAENVIFVDFEKETIKKAIKKAISKQFKKRVQNCHNPYGDGHTSERIVNILAKIKINKKLLQKEQTY